MRMPLRMRLSRRARHCGDLCDEGDEEEEEESKVLEREIKAG